MSPFGRENLGPYVKIVILTGLFLLVSITVFKANAAGMGVTPTEIRIRNTFREEEYPRRFKIFNTMEGPVIFNLSATGDIREWILFYEEDNFTTSIRNVTVPGTNNKEVYAVISIPMEAANGNYSSTIYVKTIPLEMSGANTTVILGATIEVNVEVIGTQLMLGEVHRLSLMDTEVNYPLRIKYDFENTGNVIAEPVLKGVVTKDGTVVENITYHGPKVKPGLLKTISMDWNTTGKEAGSYLANMTVSLNGEILTEESLPFKLLPVGTITRRGELVSLSFVGGEPVVDLVIKIQAVFKNTGLIDTTAMFVGEVYRGENLVEVLEGHVILVEVGEEETLSAYLELTEEGPLTVEGHVIYEGKKTDVKELFINVKPRPTEPEPEPEPEPDKEPEDVPGFPYEYIILGISVGILLIWWMRRRT